MTLKRRWTATCDHPDCDVTLIVPKPDVGDDDRWSAGEYINDQGWDAAPGKPETYCPRHSPPTTEETP